MSFLWSISIIFMLLAAVLLLVVASRPSAAVDAILNHDSWMHVLFHLLFAFSAVFVFSRRVLRWQAKKRQEAIRKEVVPFLHLLRMLFEAGLSMEHILLVIEQQGKDMIPHMAYELHWVIIPHWLNSISFQHCANMSANCQPK